MWLVKLLGFEVLVQKGVFCFQSQGGGIKGGRGGATECCSNSKGDEGVEVVKVVGKNRGSRLFYRPFGTNQGSFRERGRYCQEGVSSLQNRLTKCDGSNNVPTLLVLRRS